jgi:hypothetical protein
MDPIVQSETHSSTNSPRLSNYSAILRSWLPSRGNVVFILLVAMVMFFVKAGGAFGGFLQSPAAAPSGSSGVIAYQGRLADTAGNPLTGTYPSIFRLYSQNSGGTPLWEEQWTGPNSIAISDGLFNVMLGSLAPIPQELVTGNANLWLGVTVGSDDEMIPRVQVGSVFYARQALTVPDGSISTAKISDGNITTAKIANGAVTQAKLGTDVSLIPPDGSITTAKLADGAITSVKIFDGSVSTVDLADGAISSRKFKPLAGFATYTCCIGLVSSHQDVPGTSRTITVDVPSTIYIQAMFDFSLSGSNPSACGVIKVDGIEVSPGANLAGNGVRAAVPTMVAVDLAPGTHTIVLVAFGNPGTQTLYGTTGYSYWVMAR